MSRELTERQQKFLAVLFDEAGGDVVAAKKLAGYSDKSNTSEVVKSMKDEIMEATQLYMSRNAPKAAMAMVGGLYDPTELGIRDKMTAAKELLDRTGLVKTEKMQVEATGGVVLMPPKQVEQEEDDNS
jgi:phage terminase small subunit